MKHSHTHYYVRANDNGNNFIVAHGEDEETKEKFYKFLDKKKAQKLIDDEKEITPHVKYAIVKETVIIEEGKYQ